MDFFVRHWAPYARRFPFDPPVLNMGDIREKDHWVRRAFSTCNFSFILRGRGEFRRKGKTWTVEAPCVITQWPGESPTYGPLPESTTWDEVYLIYDARAVPALRRRGYVRENCPVWPIANPDGVLAQLDELRRITKTQRPADVADVVDRLCDRMILESLVPPPGAPSDDGEDNAVRKIEAQLRRGPERNVDFALLADEHGMSPSTLRRRWKEAFAVPPGKYLLDLRMQKARRLLVESPARIGEIAAGVGFEDLLYFSRRFRLSTGLSPSAYRKRYRLRPL